MKNKLLIIGASGHGKVVADIAVKMNKWQEISFLDDNPSVELSMGLKVIGASKDISKYLETHDFIVGIGNNALREKVYKNLVELSASIATLIHPSAVIGEEVVIDEGTVVMAGAVINCSSRVGKGCIINTGSTVDHDNVLGDFVHVSPGANLAGTVEVGDNSWIGIGSIVSNNINIINNCIIGAGGVVIKDIYESGVYTGVPVQKRTHSILKGD